MMQTALFNHLPHLVIQDLTQDIAHTAAKLRAEYKLKTPDAIQIATALDLEVKTFITHDKRLARIKEMPFYIMSAK